MFPQDDLGLFRSNLGNVVHWLRSLSELRAVRLLVASPSFRQVALVGLFKKIEQLPDPIALGDVSHRGCAVDRVVIPPPHAMARDDTRRNEIGDDPLSRTFCDPDFLA